MFEANFTRVHFSEHEMAWDVHDNYEAVNIGRIQPYKGCLCFCPTSSSPIHKEVMARIVRFIDEQILDMQLAKIRSKQMTLCQAMTTDVLFTDQEKTDGPKAIRLESSDS